MYTFIYMAVFIQENILRTAGAAAVGIAGEALLAGTVAYV